MTLIGARASDLQTTARRATKRLLFDWLPIFLILLGGWVLAWQFPISTQPAANARPLGRADTHTLIWAMALGATAATLSNIFLRRAQRTARSVTIQYAGLLLAVGVVGLLLTRRAQSLPMGSVMQAAAFSLALGAFLILWAPALTRFGREVTLLDHLAVLVQKRHLLFILIRYRVLARYSQTVLGVVWIVALPLITASILTLVFAIILKPIDTEGAPYVVFVLSGLTFWTLFNQTITHGASAILRSMGLITQVYFPRELLVLAQLGESLFDFLFAMIALVVINLAYGIAPSIYFAFLPLVLVIQLTLTLGLMFFVSYLTVYIRDIPNLVGVALQLAFYLTPILYPAAAVPEQYRWVMNLNPLVALLEAYRAIVVYQHAPDFSTLYYPLVIAGVFGYTGYRFFKANEKRLSDFV